MRGLGGFRQQAHGRLQGQANHGRPLGGCGGAAVKKLMSATGTKANSEALAAADPKFLGGAPAVEVATNEPTDLATWWSREVNLLGVFRLETTDHLTPDLEGPFFKGGRASRLQRDQDDLGGCWRWQERRLAYRSRCRATPRAVALAQLGQDRGRVDSSESADDKLPATQ